MPDWTSAQSEFDNRIFEMEATVLYLSEAVNQLRSGLIESGVIEE
jgi:hypothetical protein